ncbi:MAG: hypothetical protein ABIH66_04245 [bacterium]
MRKKRKKKMVGKNLFGKRFFPTPLFQKLLAVSFLFVLAATCAGARDEEPPKEIKVQIITDEADFLVETGEYTMPGDVQIKVEDVVFHGKGLKYNQDEKIARFTNGPVRVESERGISGIMGNAEVNLEERTARAWGGCVFELEDEEKIVRIEAEEISLDEKTKVAVARTGAQFHYREKPAEEKTEGQTEDAEAREFHFYSGRITYDYGNQKVVAGKEPRFEFEDGSLTAPEIRADLAGKVINANNVEVVVDDIAARAGSAMIYYIDEKAVLADGVTAEQDKKQMQAEKININYRKGQRGIHLEGKGILDLIVGGGEKEKPEDTGGGNQ